MRKLIWLSVFFAAIIGTPAKAGLCYVGYPPIALWSISQVPNGDGRYRYYISVYNRKGFTYTFDLAFSGFQRVVLGSPVMANLQLSPFEMIPDLLFGFGTNANINRQSVEFVYDQRPSRRGGATVRITNCRQG
ncbi:MAG: hypothetical protein K2X11_21050 [Acetobacteraceae bacterium]|nr:hypothetical protein [Acetobacteraceae bacterium]